MKNNKINNFSSMQSNAPLTISNGANSSQKAYGKKIAIRENKKAECIIQEDANKAAWIACDNFRCSMDAVNYKEYIFVILFLKYVSDAWNALYEKQRKRYGDHVDIKHMARRSLFIVPENANFYYLYNKRNEHNIGEIINNAIASIEKQNIKNLRGLSSLNFNSETDLGKTEERNHRLKNLLEDLNKPQLDIRSSRISKDIMGNVCDYLIESFTSDAGQKDQECYAEHKVSKLVAKLCDPKVGSRICGFIYGSGGFLIETIKILNDRNYAIYGIEIDNSTSILCRMNLFLHKMYPIRIDSCDRLVSYPLFDECGDLTKFEYIVANLPFLLNKWEADQTESDIYHPFWRNMPAELKSDYALISHMIANAVAGQGRVVVIVQNESLVHGTSEWQIRENLIKDNMLDAVIGLPKNLFSTTSNPMSILIFDRSREKGGTNANVKDVLFIDASQDYQLTKTQDTLSDIHIDKILNIYKNRSKVTKYSYRASYDEIKANDFNLNISRYIDTFESKTEIKVAQKKSMQFQNELNN